VWEEQLSPTPPTDTRHDPWLARHLPPAHLGGKMPVRAVVLLALGARLLLGQTATEPTRLFQRCHLSLSLLREEGEEIYQVV
jgi:hypothetical protein